MFISNLQGPALRTINRVSSFLSGLWTNFYSKNPAIEVSIPCVVVVYVGGSTKQESGGKKMHILHEWLTARALKMVVAIVFVALRRRCQNKLLFCAMLTILRSQPQGIPMRKSASSGGRHRRPLNVAFHLFENFTFSRTVKYIFFFLTAVAGV